PRCTSTTSPGWAAVIADWMSVNCPPPPESTMYVLARREGARSTRAANAAARKAKREALMEASLESSSILARAADPSVGGRFRPCGVQGVLAREGCRGMSDRPSGEHRDRPLNAPCGRGGPTSPCPGRD